MTNGRREAFSLSLLLQFFLAAEAVELLSDLLGAVVDIDGSCRLSQILQLFYFDREKLVLQLILERVVQFLAWLLAL